MKNISMIVMMAFVISMTGCNSIKQESRTNPVAYQCSDCEKKMQELNAANASLSSENETLKNENISIREEMDKSKPSTVLRVFMILGAFAAGCFAMYVLRPSRKV